MIPQLLWCRFAFSFGFFICCCNKQVLLCLVVGGGGFHDTWDLGSQKPFHHSGPSLMRPNEVWTRLDDWAARAQAPGCQGSSCRSVILNTVTVGSYCRGGSCNQIYSCAALALTSRSYACVCRGYEYLLQTAWEWNRLHIRYSITCLFAGCWSKYREMQYFLREQRGSLIIYIYNIYIRIDIYVYYYYI